MKTAFATLCCSMLIASFKLEMCYSQTFSWSGFPDGGTNYSTGIMDVTITSSAPGFQYGSPKYHANDRVGYDGCGIPGGLALEQQFGNVTSAYVLVELDFTLQNTSAGACGDITFSIMDINANALEKTFADWVEITAIDGNGNSMPNTSFNAVIDQYKTIIPSTNGVIVRGTSDEPCDSRNSRYCTTVDFKVIKPATSTIRKVYIKYHPDYDSFPCDYALINNPNRPSFQYISISEISIVGSLGPLGLGVETFDACLPNLGAITVDSVIGGTAPYVYNLNGMGDTPNNEFPDLTPGTYNLRVNDMYGCSYLKKVVILGFESPDHLTYEVMPQNCSETEQKGYLEITDVSNGTSPYVFSFDQLESGRTISGINSGQHILTVTDAHGCRYTENVYIENEDIVDTLIIPNVFSPNGDGVNSFWLIDAECIQQLNLTIVNRWGDVIKTFNDPDDYWDGKYHWELVSEGVYFYIGEIVFWDDIHKSISGNIYVFH